MGATGARQTEGSACFIKINNVIRRDVSQGDVFAGQPEQFNFKGVDAFTFSGMENTTHFRVYGN